MNKWFAVSDEREPDVTTTYHYCESAEEAIKIAYIEDGSSSALELYAFELKSLGKFKVRKVEEVVVTKVK